ncbi:MULTISPECIES: ParB/RepB/Spo0J family partition protein [unclassified Sulfitobacter]|uniref:ParB/RepB/Spo0J family partition protein n=1 Tax=unclassified Sulfitobacter TaxID=196795 RepID=UPI00082DFAF1|nr:MULTISPECIES: ParB N-terminal domain-containing protein [unclassified Sulfitobacter]
MAKRKRLTAPDPERLAVPQERHAMPISDIPTGIIPTPRRAPIADVAGQASAVAALEKVAAEMQAARSEGRMAIKIALEDIAGNYLSRDRVALDEAEMEVLTASLRSRGQQTPIEVVEIEGGKYGLISGFRRVQALRAMADTGEGPNHALAFVRHPEDASDAYTAMVEENEIRVGLTFFERAHIVRKSVAAGVFSSEGEALKELFASASRAKRSKIKSFMPVVDQLGSVLVYPNAVTERLGLALAARLGTEEGFGSRLRDRLRKAVPKTAEDETELLTKALQGKQPKAPAAKQSQKTAVGSETGAGKSVEVSFKPGELRLSGPGVTPALAAQIRALLETSEGA